MGVFLQLIEAILYNSSTHGISVTVCSSMRCTMRIIPDVSGLLAGTMMFCMMMLMMSINHYHIMVI